MRDKANRLRVFVFGMVALFCIVPCRAANDKIGIFPDAIYYNGKIVTVDKSFSTAEALAVLDDKIVAVGTSRQILPLAGAKTVKVDLHGRTVIPGLSDDHYHYLSNASNDFREISLVRATSFDEFLAIIKKRADSAPAGEVLATQSGWLPDQFDGRLPTKADLDKAAPNNPLLVRGGHTMYLNSAALKMAGITAATPSPAGGVIAKDPKTGEPNGELVDNAISLASKFLPQESDADKLRDLKKAQMALNSVGLTSVRDPGVGPSDIRVYQTLWDSGEMTVRVSTSLNLPSEPSAKQILAMLSPWGVHTRFGDHMLRLDGIGEFGMDGGFQAALMREPYANAPDVGDQGGPFYGLQRIPTEKFEEVIRGLNALGWRACIHAAGDKSVDIVLDAYEKANADHSIVGKRWTIEHGLVTDKDQLARINKLGVIISSQYHTYMASRTMIQDWGKERGEESSRVRDWLDAGVHTGMGTDWTLMPPNPFEVLSFLVTRKNRFGELVGPDQRITRKEALRLGTIDNAYITFEEGVKGSIEPGKLADFIVLDRDYLTVADDDIKNIVVLKTVVGGKVVYEKQ
jgi:predicted amidohydrolase YtcJ